MALLRRHSELEALIALTESLYREVGFDKIFF